MMRLILWEIFALALFYSCFCRAAHTSKANTKRDVRWAFTFLGVMAVLCVIAPIWGYQPDGLSIALAGAIAVVQVTTAHHWRKGVPDRFRRDL